MVHTSHQVKKEYDKFAFKLNSLRSLISLLNQFKVTGLKTDETITFGQLALSLGQVKDSHAYVRRHLNSYGTAKS